MTDRARDARLPELPDSFGRVHNDGYWTIRTPGTERFTVNDSRYHVGAAQEVYNAEQMRAYALEALARGAVDGEALRGVAEALKAYAGPQRQARLNGVPADLLYKWAEKLQDLARQPAPSQPADAVREIASDLRHSAKVDDYEPDQIRFIDAIADRIESALAQPAAGVEPNSRTCTTPPRDVGEGFAWVSVNDRLPTPEDYAEFDDVLVRYRYTDVPGRHWDIGESFHDEDYAKNGGWLFGSCDYAEVTHWVSKASLLTAAPGGKAGA